MRTEIASELKSLRLYGMASAWDDLLGQGETAALQSARWLLEHLLQFISRPQTWLENAEFNHLDQH